MRVTVLIFVGMFCLSALVAEPAEPGSAAEQWRPVLLRKRTLTVMDATDKLVGHVVAIAPDEHLGLESNTVVLVSFEVQRQPFILWVGRHGFRGTAPSTSNVVFDGPNCTGTPFIFVDIESGALQRLGRLVPPSVISPPVGVVYVAQPEATPQTVMSMSTRNGETGECHASVDQVSDHVPATAVIDLRGRFTPPFRLQ